MRLYYVVLHVVWYTISLPHSLYTYIIMKRVSLYRSPNRYVYSEFESVYIVYIDIDMHIERMGDSVYIFLQKQVLQSRGKNIV